MAEPEPAGAEPEDGTVDFFVQLLTKMKIKPANAREYAEGLAAQEQRGFFNVHITCAWVFYGVILLRSGAHTRHRLAR